jgi:malonate-semialdehyde dehydrogenase (acetylating)/methylmalonate-semialdehyde dehydrogenase
MTTKTTVPCWIDGKPLTPEARLGDVFDPATGQVARRVPLCGAGSIDAAVGAAARALPAWRETPPLRRSRVMQEFLRLLREHQSELAAIVTAEHGKTLEDAAGSVQRGLEVVEFACGIPQLLKGQHSENVGPGIDSYSRRQPVGVCAGITPFNFPVMVPLWMFPVAIACGNSFVLKPSERDPSASIRMAELFKEAGLPDGVFNVVHGDREAVEAILAHPGIGAVSFVGSTPIARHIYETAAKHGKRVQALGGAKNHAVVMPDADLEFAADALIGAGYGSAGERCMAISAIVAVGAAADPLVALLAKKAAAVRIGAGNTKNVDMGPLITGEHLARVASYVEAGSREGATLVADGRKASLPKDGFFIGPTLFDRVEPRMSIYRDEIFGPVLSVLRVATLDAAIALINANPYANGTAIFTASGAAARKFETEIEVGMVGINVPIPVPVAYHSFGGWRGSLFGDLHMHGEEGVKFYTRSKVVTSRWPAGSAGGGGFSMPTPVSK